MEVVAENEDIYIPRGFGAFWRKSINSGAK